MKGKKAEDFLYTCQSGTSQVAGVDDGEVFVEVDNGLKSCAFTDEDRKALYEVRAVGSAQGGAHQGEAHQPSTGGTGGVPGL